MTVAIECADEQRALRFERYLQSAAGAAFVRGHYRRANHHAGQAHLAANPSPAVMSEGGGGGIRTPVRTYIPAGIYDAYPPLMCRARRREAAKPPSASPGKSRR